MHLRGREELICSVINKPSIPILLSASNSPAVSMTQTSLKSSLPRESSAITLSHKLQRRLSGYGFINVGLPPASPSDEEIDFDESSTMFLIGAYSRYGQPYVWVRSNHERLIKFSSPEENEKDFPLNLKTTSNWESEDVHVWDIVCEVVQVCTDPCPTNPFEVDLEYFEALPSSERLLATAAMINFLQKLIASGKHSYDKKVLRNLQKVSQIHFQSMAELVQDGKLGMENRQNPHQQTHSQASHIFT